MVLESCHCSDSASYNLDSADYFSPSRQVKLDDGLRNYVQFYDSIEIFGARISQMPFQGITYSPFQFTETVVISMSFVDSSLHNQLF